MHPGVHARERPDRIAHRMARGADTVTYAELDARSNRLARLLRRAGLQPGDHIALFSENHPRYFEVVWAALRSGLYVTPINSYLTAGEAAYIVEDCGASALIASAGRGDVAAELADRVAHLVPVRLAWDGVLSGYEAYEDAVAGESPEPLAEQPRGDFMFYSSGTTGRPKGIERPLSGRSIDDQPALGQLLESAGILHRDAVYLSPAPLYHAAPLAYCIAVQALGGTVIVMERFDPVEALELIERHRVTHSQWVPTMFIRMLKLPPEVRNRYDLSSMEVAIHAAAPCPVPVKQAMLDWWGPIIHEYYAGSEGNGSTWVTPEEWLAHPGTVGRPRTAVHICDDEGNELGPGEAGTIYFEAPDPSLLFRYHNDPDKTAASRHPVHETWTTLGDIGYVDTDGYLYLTDRKAFMIISGGVNIYPQEVEDVLVSHPAVLDVAVFGVPDPEMGESVKAVVQPAPGVTPGPELERELIAWCRERLAHYKCPRSVDFLDELPRLPTGKLYKRLLRDRYWGRADTTIV